MDYYRYHQLLSQQQNNNHLQQNQLQQNIQHLYTTPLINISQPFNQIPNAQNQYSAQQQLQQGIFMSDNQFIGQPCSQLQDFNKMDFLIQQQQLKQVLNPNAQIQLNSNSILDHTNIGNNTTTDISQQVFFQKAIENSYMNDIQQNRQDIISNYLNIISRSKMNRNSSNDSRTHDHRSSSYDHWSLNKNSRNRNFSQDNKNQNSINDIGYFNVNNNIQTENKFSTSKNIIEENNNQNKNLNIPNQHFNSNNHANLDRIRSQSNDILYQNNILQVSQSQPNNTIQFQKPLQLNQIDTQLQFRNAQQVQYDIQNQLQQQQYQQQLLIQNQNLQQYEQPWAEQTQVHKFNQQFAGEANTQSAFNRINPHQAHHLSQQQQHQINLRIDLNGITQAQSSIQNDEKRIEENKQTTQISYNINQENTVKNSQQKQIQKSTEQPVQISKSSEDIQFNQIEQEISNLQKQITAINQQMMEVNQSQSEILSLNSNKKELINYLEQQIQNIQDSKKQVFEKIDEYQTLKQAYMNFKQFCPEGTYQQFKSLSKETQKFFTNSNLQISSQSTQKTSNPIQTSVKIEFNPLNSSSSNDNQSTIKEVYQIENNHQQQQIDLKDKESLSQSENLLQNSLKSTQLNDIQENQISEQQINKKDLLNLSFSDQQNNSQKNSQQSENQYDNNLLEQNYLPEKQQIQNSDELIIQKNHEQQEKQNEQIDLQNVVIEKDQNNDKIDNSKQVCNVDHDDQNIIEEDQDKLSDEENNDEEEMNNENTSVDQTKMSIAQKLSSMNVAESKRFDKRREKLEENVLKILSKQEDACSMIKPIAIQLCAKIAVENDILKNRPYEAISAAIIVHASRLVANPITVKKMAKITESKEKIINRVFMYLKKNIEGFNNKMPQPEVFIKNICDRMQLSEDISKTAFYLHQQSDNLGLVKGQHAATIAACIVKLAASLNNVEMTVKQICEASNVCQISLRQLYRIIYPYRFDLIGDNKTLGIDFKKALNSPQISLE